MSWVPPPEWVGAVGKSLTSLSLFPHQPKGAEVPVPSVLEIPFVYLGETGWSWGDWAQGCWREVDWPATCSLPARPASLRHEACEVTTTLGLYCFHSPNWPRRSKATASQRLQGWVTWAEGPSGG